MGAHASTSFPCNYIKWVVSLFFLFFTGAAASQAPVANFSATPVTGCAPLIVSFTDLSTGSPTSWSWDLGNGVTSTSQNPSTFYTLPGTYTIRLTVTNASGTNTITRTNYITVNVPPTVDFTSDVNSGCFPLRVQFTDNSVSGFGTITRWRWSFGNGDTSALQNPVYTYTSSGSYLVSLTITNSAGCTQTLVRNNYINVSNGVTANFSFTAPANCRPPETINFTNQTVGPAVLSYQWDFGDGTTSVLTNPSHTYTGTGPYTVRLIAASTQGCIDTITQADAIVLNNYQSSMSVVDSACVNTTVTFQNTSTPAPISSYWDFGNGNTSTDTNPVTFFAGAGNYTVRLVNQYPTCNDTVTQNITVTGAPAANFTAAATTSCQAPFTTTFTNLTSGAVSYLWNFGDGSSSTDFSPTHTFSSNGNFTVTLIAFNSFGCADTIVRSNYIVVQRPVLNPLFSVREGCSPLTVQMQANSSSIDNIVSWFWDFGNGNTSTLQNPTFTFDSGSYAIRLRIVTTQGCVDSVRFDSIRVGVPPVAAFSFAPSPACAFQQIQFTDLSTGNPNQWAWNFRDGNGSVQRNPIHTYTDTTGTFRALLIAYNNRCADTVEQDIQVLPPVARFTYNIQCQVNKRAVNFSSQSSFTPGAVFTWNFGDGSPTSNAVNPTHVYSSLGTYTVTLSITDGPCTHSVQQTVRIVDELADFNVSAQTACRNQLLNFTSINYNPANIAGYYWNFGDSFTATSQNAQHTYTTSGDYTVTFATVDINGCRDTVVKNNYIRINGPVASFTIAQTQICLSSQLSLTSSAVTDGVNPISSIQWLFGDGNSTSSLSSPVLHQYANPGSYQVTQIVTDASGCSDTVTNAAIVEVISPVVSFSADTISCPGAPVQFTSTVTGVTGVLQYQWNFGDGSPTSSASNPVHAFALPGTYTVSLVVTEPGGCTGTFARTISINYPVSSFTVNDSISICRPFPAQYSNNSSYAASYVWNFGDGNTSTATNPAHLYAQPGTYLVRLIAVSPGGCADSSFQTIRVGDATGTITYSPLVGCNPLTTNLRVTTSVPLEYSWDFGDGNTEVSTDSLQTHTYGAGYFVPKVIIRDRLGCVGIIEGIDTIRAYGSNPNFGIDSGFFCGSGTVQFIDSTYSSDQIISYLWDFGDGTTSTSVTAPQHTYSTPGIYDVTLTVTTLNGCVNSYTKPALIRVVSSPSIAIIGDSNFCAPADILLQAQLLNPDTSSINWQWNIDGTIFNTQVLPTITRLLADTIPVQLIATNGSGCSDTAFTTLIVHAPPPVFAGNDTTICLNDQATLTATGAQAYFWNSSPSLSCTSCTSPIASPVSNTTYYVTGISQYGCTNTDSVFVRVRQPFTINVSANDTICIGETIQLSANGAENYTWSPAAGLSNPTIANPLASPTNTTTYTVTGFDSSNCFTDVRTVTVFVYNYPTVSAGNDTTILAGATVPLFAAGSPDITSYLWTPATRLSCTTCNNPLATPSNNTTYTVEVRNIAGCTTTDNVTVFVGCVNGRIYIPNAFTPNNDGLNDRFFVIGEGVQTIKRMIVYDRWGKAVYSKENFLGNNAADGWDGNFNRIAQPPGVYAYITDIECGDGTVFRMQGIVTLIR